VGIPGYAASRFHRNFVADEKTPLIGGGGVAEMWRMVEFHTDLTAGLERESGGPSSLRSGSHNQPYHQSPPCITYQIQ
jgi:hypothetical protein